MKKRLFVKLSVISALAFPFTAWATPEATVPDFPFPGITTEFEYTKHAPHNYSYKGQLGLDPSTDLPSDNPGREL